MGPASKTRTSRVRTHQRTYLLRFVMGIFVSLLIAMVAFSLSANAQSFAYITNNSSKNVSVIDTATNTVVATVPVGNSPAQLAATPQGSFVYVTNYSDDTVSVISTANNAVVSTINVGMVSRCRGHAKRHVRLCHKFQ